MDDDIMNRFNFTDGSEEEEVRNNKSIKLVPGLPKNSLIRSNNAVGMSCIPHLGQYGDEYQWIHPTMSMRCFPMDINHKKRIIFNLLPSLFVYFQDSEGNMN